jgi:hypothetical protein
MSYAIKHLAPALAGVVNCVQSGNTHTAALIDMSEEFTPPENRSSKIDTSRQIAVGGSLVGCLGCLPSAAARLAFLHPPCSRRVFLSWARLYSCNSRDHHS